MSELRFRSGGKKNRIKILQTRYAQGAGKKCLLMLFNGDVIEYPYPLKHFYEKARPFGFVDAQKSYVVNPNAVIDTGHKHHHFAVLDNGEKLYITEEAYLVINAFRAALRKAIVIQLPLQGGFPSGLPN